MTLRIAKLEEPNQHGSLSMQRPAPAQMVAAEPSDREPEVCGVPGLVKSMIGLFSSIDNKGISNGYIHVKHSKANSPNSKSHAISPVPHHASSPSSAGSCSPSKVSFSAEENHGLVNGSASVEVGGNEESGSNIRNSYHRIQSARSPARTAFKNINFNCSNRNSESSINTESMPDNTLPNGLTLLSTESEFLKSRDLSKSESNPNKAYDNNDSANVDHTDHGPPVYVNKVAMSLSTSSRTVDPNQSVEVEHPRLMSNDRCDLSDNVINNTLSDNNCNGLGDASKCNDMGNLNSSKLRCSPLDVEKDGHYFLRVIEDTETHLMKCSSRLETILQQEQIPEDASGKIRAAIGKATLLCTKKFKQFRELCDKNLNQSKDEPFQTTSEDLIGFWDLVQLQVTDVNRLFDEIEELRLRNWVNLEPEIPASPKPSDSRPLNHTSTPVAKKSKAAPRSSEASKAREEARKRLMAAKMAGRQRKASETEEDVQIFIS